MAVAEPYHKMKSDIDKLRAFANDIIDILLFEDGIFESFDIQELAIKQGILTKETIYENCGQSCHCAEYSLPEEFKAGVECCRKTELLK